MSQVDLLFVKYVAVGVCGLSCYLCPNHNTDAKSRCEGCKSEGRMGAACPFLTCAVKKKRIEFCWDRGESGTCEKWRAHREAGKHGDSFKCYQKLEDDDRSKSYYCIAATVLEPDELREAIDRARSASDGLDAKAGTWVSSWEGMWCAPSKHLCGVCSRPGMFPRSRAEPQIRRGVTEHVNQA